MALVEVGEVLGEIGEQVAHLVSYRRGDEDHHPDQRPQAQRDTGGEAEGLRNAEGSAQ